MKAVKKEELRKLIKEIIKDEIPIIPDWISVAIMDDHKAKAISYYLNFREKVILEMFEDSLDIIDMNGRTVYFVGNNKDIEAEYRFSREGYNENKWSVHWEFTDSTKIEDSKAWKLVTATAYNVIIDFIDEFKPSEIEISGNGNGSKLRIYKSESFLSKFRILLNNRYYINVEKNRVVFSSIQDKNNKIIENIVNRTGKSYSNILFILENGDINAKSKIERWDAIKKKIERETLKEILNIK